MFTGDIIFCQLATTLLSVMSCRLLLLSEGAVLCSLHLGLYAASPGHQAQHRCRSAAVRDVPDRMAVSKGLRVQADHKPAERATDAPQAHG